MNNKTEIDYLNYEDLNLVEEKIKECTDRANEAMSPQINKVIDGKSTQETTTGKNLFDIKDWLSTLGATYTENSDGSITFKPISALYNTTYPIKETDRCMMSFKIKNETGTNFRFRYVYEDGAMRETSGSGTGTSEVSVATSSSVPTAHGKVIGIRGNWTTVGKFTIKECMLEQYIENVSPQPYEPYTGGQPSPSPDYPQEIENVKGKNLFNGNAVSTTTPANWGITFENDILTIQHKNSYSTGAPTLELGNNLSGNYTFSYTSSISERKMSLYIDGTYSKLISNGETIEFENGKAYTIKFGVGANETIAFTKPMIEKGSVATRYVPYGNIQIIETGKNLFDKDTYNTATYAYSDELLNTSQVMIMSFKDKDTSIDISNLNIGFVIYDGDNLPFYYKWVIRNGIIRDDRTNIASQDKSVYCMQWFVYPNNAVETLTQRYDIQIEKGSVATDYEPYTEEVVNIDLKGNELCSLPNGTKDELIVKDGRAKIIKRIGKVILDGSENWNVYTTTNSQGNTYGYHVSLSLQPLQEKHANNFALSNYFIQQRRDAVSIVDTQGIYLGVGTTMFIKIAQNLISGGTLKNFKTWLSTHNTIVYYALAEPYEIDLGPLEVYFTYETKKWEINELPYIQEIDRIEKGIYNLGEKYNRPKGWLPTKEWITKDNLYPIKGFDYRDWNRWVNNLSVFTTDIVVKDTIWNGASFINWGKIGKDEWR